MTMLPEPLKRVKCKVKKCQNPLFEKWLKEWKEEAAKNGSEMQYCFNKALKSLKKFPIKLNSGKECMMLENFGAKICQMLDDKLEKYKALHPDDLSVNPKTSNNSRNVEINGGISLILNDVKKKRKSQEHAGKKRKSLEKFNSSNEKKRKNSECTLENNEANECTDFNNKKMSYVPGYRSGPYAILLTLFKKSKEENYKGYMTKSEIQKEAQDLCDTSFTKALPGCYYTAWSSMGILVKKKLVNKEGNPAKFNLTEEGTELALKLKQIEPADLEDLNKPASPIKNKEGKKDSPKKIQKPKEVKEKKPKKSPNKQSEVFSQQSQEQKEECVSEPDETVFLLPGTFEIKLLVDTQERDDKFQQSSSMTMRQLKSRNVNFEIRHLKVGDFIWVAKDGYGNELVLPYIVERKRMDDLGSSIKDGRFHEQKFRLKQSGVENLIYLVEKYGNENQRLGLPLPTLLQAISNTQVLGGFTVKVTNNHDDSMRYLDCMTTQLNTIFKNKTLMSCKKSNLPQLNLSEELISLMTFKDFNKGSEKNRKPTVRQMLVKHLIQLSGVSLEKANAIVQLYPTPKALMQALKDPSGEKSIADLTYGGLSRSIGPVTAKQIHSLYTSMELQ